MYTVGRQQYFDLELAVITCDMMLYNSSINPWLGYYKSLDIRPSWKSIVLLIGNEMV